MNRLAHGTVIAAVVAMVSLSSVSSFAQPAVTGTLSNFDVYNRTGQEANDFDLVLDGIAPGDIGNLYTGDYPNVSVVPTAGGTRIRWTGSSTPPGGSAHFGLTLADDLDPSAVQMNWTFNGANTGNLPDVWQIWNSLISGVVRDDITNRSTLDLLIQRRVNERVEPVALSDLLRGGQLWNTATLIDPAPIPLPPGATALYDFGGFPMPGNVLMFFDVFTTLDPDVPLMTFLNGASVVPEPAALSLMAAAAVLMAWRRLRR
jgi:hypothetical protein